MKVLILYLIIALCIGQAFGQKAGGVELVEFSQSSCDRTSDPYRLKPRIISLEHLGDTIVMEIGFAETCCLEYIPTIKYLADTLYIRYKAKDDDGCSCICCYSFNLKIKGLSSSKFSVKLFNQTIELSAEKYQTYDPTFALVEGDTINLTDKYGIKQGIWLVGSSYYKYKDDRYDTWGHVYGGFKITKSDTINQKDKHGLKQGVWTVGSENFIKYKDGKIDELGYRYTGLKIEDEYNDTTKLYREFYRDGKLKKECRRTSDWKLVDCRQWDTNGVEIK